MYFAVRTASALAVVGLALLAAGGLLLRSALRIRVRTTPGAPEAEERYPWDVDAEMVAQGQPLVSRFSRDSGDGELKLADELKDIQLPPSSASIGLYSLERDATPDVPTTENEQEPEQPSLALPLEWRAPESEATDTEIESEPEVAPETEGGAGAERVGQSDPQIGDEEVVLEGAPESAAAGPEAGPEAEGAPAETYASLVREHLNRLRSPDERSDTR
jgi:hypothetical protein